MLSMGFLKIIILSLFYISVSRKSKVAKTGWEKPGGSIRTALFGRVRTLSNPDSGSREGSTESHPHR